MGGAGDSGVTVTKTLRPHETEERFIRLVGDGTPEGTALLDMQGQPISESVLRIEITVKAGRCARGEFTYYVPSHRMDPELSVSAFEAWVIFEQPPAPTSVPVSDYNDLVESFNSLLGQYDLALKAVSAAKFALQAANPLPETSSTPGTAIPGPSAQELLKIADKPE